MSVQDVLVALLLPSLLISQKHRHLTYSYSSARGAFLEPRSFTSCSPGHGDLLFGTVFLDDFWLCFAFPAMGISVLVFDWFFGFILLRLEGHWG